jgi:hypothetical protein
MSGSVVEAAIAIAVAAACGLLVGMGELVSRYQDAPGRAVRTPSGALYCGINAVAAAIAILFVRAMGLTFGFASGVGSYWAQIIVAGFGAMAILRSSLFTAHIDDKDIPIGPSSFLQIILDAADRDVDRRRAQSRSLTVPGMVQNIPFSRGKDGLTALCFALVRNVPVDIQREFRTAADNLAASNQTDELKMVQHGLQLSLIVGEKVLDQAATILRKQLKEEEAVIPVTEQLIKELSGIPFEDVRMNLPDLAMTLSSTIPNAEKQMRVNEVQILASTPMPEPMRALTLAVSLSNIVGSDTVLRAARILQEFSNQRTSQRDEASRRFDELSGMLSAISFEELRNSLPTLAATLCSRPLTPEDRKMLTDQAAILASLATTDPIRTVTFITVIQNVVGEDVLFRAAKILTRHKASTPPKPAIIPPPVPPASPPKDDPTNLDPAAGDGND